MVLPGHVVVCVATNIFPIFGSLKFAAGAFNYGKIEFLTI
jgi:hypothetical protein